MARDSRVVAITSFRPHKECLLQSEREVERDEGEDIEEDRDEMTPEDHLDGSALPGNAKRKRSRSFTSSQLEHALRPDFEAHGRRWTAREVRERISRIDPGAVGIAGYVLEKLRRVHRVKKETSTKLIQGLALCLRRRGFGVVLHTASASSVREQALELARKKYYGEARKRGISKVARFKRSAVATALTAIRDTFVRPDVGEVPAEYLVGYTVVPPAQMDGGHENFPPCDAIDCAAVRGRASGILIVRGKKDANSNLHAASLSHMLAAEGDLSLGAPTAAEKALLPKEAFNTPDYVTLVDGGASLKSQNKMCNPEASLLRCSRHLLDECIKGSATAKASVAPYKKLMQIPKGHNRAADRIYDTLPMGSPLRRIPKEELAPVYLPPVSCW